MQKLESLKDSNFQEITKEQMSKIEGGMRIWSVDHAPTNNPDGSTSFTREWRYLGTGNFSYSTLWNNEKND